MGMLSVIKHAPKLAKALGKTAFALRKAKPQILVGGGLLIATGAFVLAIANARKMDAVIAEGNDKIDALEAKKAELQSKNDQTALAVIEKDILKAKRDNILQMTKLIGIPSVIFVGGIAMTLGGHIDMVRRFGSLSVAFAGLKESFDRYRQMNIAEHGKDCDRRYIHGVVGETEVETTITDANGQEHTVKTVVPIVDQDKASRLYSFEFSQAYFKGWTDDPMRNIFFLKAQQKYWNQYLSHSGKPVTLAEVLNDLGYIYDPDNVQNDYFLIAGWRANGDGDNFIDFDIYNAINKPAINGQTTTIYLNFNCDGNIYHSPRYTKDGRRITA